MSTKIKLHVLTRIACLGIIVGLTCGIVAGCKFGNKSSDSVDSSDHSTVDSHNDNSVDNSGGGDNLNNDFEPVCSRTVNGIDGPGGFLWKAESDLDGNLAILFPSSFTTAFISVCVSTKDGVNECGVFNGFDENLTDDSAVPDTGSALVRRQVWRFTMPGSEYIGVVKVDHTNELCIWVVSDTSTDQD
jgi:hypothetical protein